MQLPAWLGRGKVVGQSGVDSKEVLVKLSSEAASAALSYQGTSLAPSIREVRTWVPT